MTPVEPYLIEAFHTWIIDNNHTPLIQVDATQPEVIVPQENVVDGMITFNVNNDATEDFFISEGLVSFKTRFNGISTDIMFPTTAVRAIFSRESGQGMVFGQNPEDTPPNVPTPPVPPQGSIKKEHHTPKKPKLKIVR